MTENMMKFQHMPLRFRVYDKTEQKMLDHRNALDVMRLISVGGDKFTCKEFLEENYIISQDTGLKDKNGENVYTGDIVKCWDGEAGLVYYDESLAKMRVKFVDGDDESLFCCEPEVIGNIWENPELLEEK